MPNNGHEEYIYLVRGSRRTESKILWKSSSVEGKGIVAVEGFFSLAFWIADSLAIRNDKENDKDG